jgi:uncharacterized protein
MPFLRAREDGKSELRVRVQPGAKQSMIDGIWNNERLNIKLHAPPVDGKANTELIRFLAEITGLSKRSFEITAGPKSREKTVLLPPRCSTTNLEDC